MRVPLSEVIFQGNSPVRTASGREVYVYQRGTSTQVTLYASQTGSTTLPQPLTTDSGGRPERNGTMPWLEPGSYDLKVDGVTTPWEAAGGRDGSFEVTDDYSTKANGAFTRADTVQTYEFAQKPVGAATAYQLVDGAATVTTTAAGAAAAYAHVLLPTANRASVTFSFLDSEGDPVDPSTATGGGTVFLGPWLGAFPPGYATAGSPPDCPAHLICTEQGTWSLRLVYEGIVTPALVSGTMADPPPMPWTMDLAWEGNSVTFVLPDGSVHSVEDKEGRIEELLKQAGEEQHLRVGHEVFMLEAATDSRPVVHSWAAADDEFDARPGSIANLVQAAGIADRFAPTKSTALLNLWVSGEAYPRVVLLPEGIALGDGTKVADAFVGYGEERFQFNDDVQVGSLLKLIKERGVIQFVETSAPALLANSGQVYAKDDGSGNTQLRVRFPSNDRLLAADNLGEAPRTVALPSDFSLAQSSETLQDVTGLAVPVEVNASYFIEAVLRLTAPGEEADWKFGWSGPSGATANWLNLANEGGVAAASVPSAMLIISQTLAMGAKKETAEGVFHIVRLAGWFNTTATAGAIQFRAAQNTSKAETQKVLKSSFLRLEKLL